MVWRCGLLPPLLMLLAEPVAATTTTAAEERRSFLRRVGRHAAARFDEQRKIARAPRGGSRWPSKCPEFVAAMPSARAFARLQRGRVPFVVRRASELFDPEVAKLADPAFLSAQPGLGDARVDASVFPRRRSSEGAAGSTGGGHRGGGGHKSTFPVNASRWFPRQPAERELLLQPFSLEMSMREAVARLWGNRSSQDDDDDGGGGGGDYAIGLEQASFFQEGDPPELPLSALRRVLRWVPPLFGQLGDLAAVNLWLGRVDGGRGKHTPLHVDGADNFLLVLGGRKKVLMFSYADSHNLYAKTMLRVGAEDPRKRNSSDGGSRPLAADAAEALLAYDVAVGAAEDDDAREEDADARAEREKEEDGGGLLADNFAPVDTQRPDAGRFPHFRAAQPLVCTLDAGDMLYMPQLTWHDIQSYGPDPATHDGVSAALNFWFEGDAHFNVLYHSLMSLVREGHAGVTGDEASARRQRGDPHFHRRAGRVWEFEEGELGAKNGDRQPVPPASVRRGMARAQAVASGGARISLFESRQAGWDYRYWGSNDPPAAPTEPRPHLFRGGKWNPAAEARANEFGAREDSSDAREDSSDAREDSSDAREHS